MDSLTALFNPSSVAVVGASIDSQTLGTVILNNIIKNRYKGGVFPINPKYQEVAGLKCYPKVSAVGQQIDMIVIVVPTQFVLEVVRDAADSGVKAAVIITAGFGELGEDGKKLEKEIKDYANSKGMRILGPNCLGVISTEASLNASFAAQFPKPGDIAFLSQSGAFNSALLDMADASGLGFAHFLSLGNKSDINELELLEGWLNDDKIKVIGMYIEQFSDGAGLINTVLSNPRKPIVMLYSGKSESGKKAASSHTGSMTGSAKVISTALKQVGITEVDSIEQMFSDLMLFSWGRNLEATTGKITVVTNAGGPGIILTDLLSRSDLKIVELSAETQAQLHEKLPKSASTKNPVDIIGDALADRYKGAIEILSKSNETDLIIPLLTPQMVTQVEETAKIVAHLGEVAKKPILPVFEGDSYIRAGIMRLWDSSYPAFTSAEGAVKSIQHAVHYNNFIKSQSEVTNLESQHPSQFLKRQTSRLMNGISPEENRAIEEPQAKSMARQTGLDLPREELAHELDQVLQFHAMVGGPIVIKATTEDVPHKTDMKALYLNLNTAETVTAAFNQLKADLIKLTGKPSPTVLVQEQIVGGEELIIGINYDQNFGHLILFGKGGIYTEIYSDTSSRILPCSVHELEKMVAETKVAKIIDGARGKPPLAKSKLIETLKCCQRLVLEHPEIREIDMNPVILTEDRCICVDLKIFA